MAVNVAVLPGWAAGKWHTRQFESALSAAGYTISDVLHSEVIIAHSTACKLLSEKNPATLLILIDPPYWPGKSVSKRYSDRNKIADQNKTKGGLTGKLKSMLHSAVYIFSMPDYTMTGLSEPTAELKFLEGYGKR
jgi:hypothetical protein